MINYGFLQIATPYLASAAGFIVCILLFLNLRAGARRSAQKVEAELTELRQCLKKAEESLVQLNADLQAAEEQFQLSAGAPARSWSNINRRTQALRLIRAGKSPRQIATQLGMSAGEVDLIVKVNSIATSSYNISATPSCDDNQNSILSMSA